MKHIPRTWLARVGVAACLATTVTFAALAGAGPAAAGALADRPGVHAAQPAAGSSAAAATAADGAPQSLGRGVDVRDPSTRSLLVAIAASVLVMLAGVSLIVAQHRLASGADRREAASAALLAARAEPTPPLGEALLHLAKVVASVDNGAARPFGVAVDAPEQRPAAAPDGHPAMRYCTTCGRPR